MPQAIWAESPERTTRFSGDPVSTPGGEVALVAEVDPPTRGPIRHQASILGRDISCSCGFRGTVQSEDCIVRQRVGHAHVANPALSFADCILFVLKGSGV